MVHYAGFADGLLNVHDVVPLDSAKQSSVSVTSLEEFSGGNGFFVREHKEAKYTPEEIIKRAKERVGEKEYNLFSKNCEHFANWCIEGEECSGQVSSARNLVGAGLVAGAGLGGARTRTVKGGVLSVLGGFVVGLALDRISHAIQTSFQESEYIKQYIDSITQALEQLSLIPIDSADDMFDLYMQELQQLLRIQTQKMAIA